MSPSREQRPPPGASLDRKYHPDPSQEEDENRGHWPDFHYFATLGLGTETGSVRRSRSRRRRGRHKHRRRGTTPRSTGAAPDSRIAGLLRTFRGHNRGFWMSRTLDTPARNDRIVETMMTADSFQLTAYGLGRTRRQKHAGAVSREPQADSRPRAGG
jgi:hypothetical protein